ncbi:MAG: prepilin-type N-terminal cleavage/methylation domain-containing protein [Deltaproteobacteria bacterium]|nr:prepilin-type N-terminal cleavage/methylation domain-containing protein [Deltaproteobacteria bacterium]
MGNGDEKVGMKTRRLTEGFSLVELLIAMALIAIVSAFAVPAFQRYADNDNLKTAAREITGDFFNTRQRAVNENTDDYRLVFDDGGNSYSLTKSGATLWTKSLADFGSGVHLETGSAAFGSGTAASFHRRGTLSQAGSLTLKNSRGSKAEITANLTGRAYVKFTMQ